MAASGNDEAKACLSWFLAVYGVRAKNVVVMAVLVIVVDVSAS